ncbi:PQQ-binding-like beta-propeller repeat protein [Rhodocytophaga aerolata]|uniref:PQQ-binding-like beta-propeller repeat protein n=1 Tax=Rhodocytophaga aerolata TaxID=455078 RepID=A0ABT8RET9_9BACT|nr:PQQ-binding-like beta-propeller repeat protein [Rhodocytophaga aerolata]MDO1450585.1 PQQ-binding-like beta-propeller repeat protein [Rhodocytophaga aerolata]
MFLFFDSSTRHQKKSDSNWPEYNGNGEQSHYSPLRQITKENVGKVKVAWEYASGGADTTGNRSQMQCNPIIIEGILYGVSANTQAFALDAATGKEKWKTSLTDNGGTTSRGVTYWANGNDKRILFGAGQWLYALDASNGKLIDSFGLHGRIDLKAGLERPGADEYVRLNTPATVYKNLVIVGVRLSEGETALLGDIRAYDIRTGKKVWTFHTIPKPGEPGYETWFPAEPRLRLGGANSWAGMAIDRKRGILFAPTGSAAYDFHGGNRKGDNLYANCLLALDAATGKKLWHFQFVHHDIWDRDLPAPPNLLTVIHQRKKTEAVAQVTKQGQVFVFDRLTGKPLFPIEEQSFSQDAVEGEFTSPTQPVPLKPTPFTKQTFTEQDINPWVADKDSILARLRKARTGSPFIPLTEEMTIIFPGTDGGAQWGGAATDLEGIIYIPAKQLPSYSSLTKRINSPDTHTLTANQLYQQHCGSCHGTDRQGSHDGSYPSLININKRLSRKAIQEVLMKGKGMMPSFSHLAESQQKTLINFILNNIPTDEVVSQKKTVPFFQHMGYNRWYDRAGYPVSTPPWGTLTAIDLNSGEHLWQVPLGEYKELTAKGIPPTGTDNYGGPLVTGSGLLFIASSRDEQIRCYDKKTGKMLWQHPLPAAGYATPSTYSVNGKQYIVIACGGGKLNTKSGDKYIAFAL